MIEPFSQEGFKSQLQSMHFDKADHLAQSFEIYREALVENNAKINLTAITKDEEIREKHFLDCLNIQDLIPKNSLVADIGTGAGFPGLVLALVRPDCHFDLIEPTTKRCGFLHLMVDKLELKNVTIINERAEDLKSYKGKYDVIAIRAVASLPILLELSMPLLKVKGKLIAMKGSSALEELREAKTALNTLKVSQTEIVEKDLPTAGKRIHLIFTKTEETPNQYPREYRLIKKKAL